MNVRHSLTRTGIAFAVAALLAAVIAAAASFVLTSRLSDEDALLADMESILTLVADEAVANTDGFLQPAEQTTDFLAAFIEDGAFDPESPEALRFLLGALRSSTSFDGISIGSADGSFIYVNRLVNDSGAAFSLKQIYVDEGDRRVEVATFSHALVEMTRIRDDSDMFDPRTRVWYQKASEELDGIWTDPYVFFSSGLPGVTRAQPVLDGEIVEYVVGVDIQIQQLSEFMAERAPSPNGAAFVMTTAQQMVAYPDIRAVGDGSKLRFASEVDDPAVLAAADAIERNIVRDVRTFSETNSIDGIRTHFVFMTLATNEDWVVSAWSPHSDFLATVRGTQRTNAYIALGLGLLILAELLAAAFWMYRRLASIQQQLVASEAASERSDLERDRAERELAATNGQLEASNRDLEQYAYAAAHDLRTPLRAIGGYSELIGREAEKDDADLGQIRSWTENIVAGYDRMGRIMDNLLNHARLSMLGVDGAELALVDTKAIAETVVADLRSELIAADGEVFIDDLPEVLADPVELSRAFQNLLENAIRFRDPVRPLVVTIDGSYENDLAKIQVSDNGVGISVVDKARIFESFAKADGSSGVGLGLSLVKRIVENHGGEIAAESEVDAGSVFELTFPGVVAQEEQ